MNHLNQNPLVGDSGMALALLSGESPSEEKHLVTLRLTIDVIYDLGSTSVDELESRLRNVADRAAGDGLLTGETDAEVDEWSARVTRPEEVDPLIVIDLDGGLVQCVTSAVPLRYVVHDHDVEGCDADEVVVRPGTEYTEGEDAEVYDSGIYCAQVAPATVSLIRTAIEQ